MCVGAVSMIASPEEAPDEYSLNEKEERIMLNETDFVKQIEENMQYPDEYIEVHFGLFLDEINVQLKDDMDDNIALFQVGMSTQFDIRPNSYLSQIGLHKIDLCLGDKRNLLNGSLLKALMTPICAQIDIETDSVDINKNKIMIHNVGVIELMLNPQIMRANMLKDGEEVTVKDSENKRAHKMFVRNAQIFGDKEWMQIKQRPKHSLFPYFGHEFVDNLVMNKEKTMIELIKHSEIDSIHYSNILSAHYFVYAGVWNESIIENKEEFMKKAQKYSFDKMEEIVFKIEKWADVRIFVQPKGVDTIYSLKINKQPKKLT